MSWRSFAESSVFARSLKLDSAAEWLDFYSSTGVYCFPSDVPKHPDIVYKANWEGWAHFLRGKVNKRTAKGKKSDSRVLGKRQRGPSPTPPQPRLIKRSRDRDLRREGSGKGNSEHGEVESSLTSQMMKRTKEAKLDECNITTIKHRSYQEAQAFAKSTGITTSKGWSHWCKVNRHEKPADIPARPDYVCFWFHNALPLALSLPYVIFDVHRSTVASGYHGVPFSEQMEEALGASGGYSRKPISTRSL